VKILHYITVLFFCFFAVLHAQQHLVFTPIDSKNGLSENRVRNIEQLNDGRMVITTEGVTNIYDGTSFKHLHLKENNICPLTGYRGFHHGYVDKDFMWMKNGGRLMLIDIQHERFVPKPDSILALMDIHEPIADFFLDAGKNYWILTTSDKLLYRNAEKEKTSVFLRHVSTPFGTEDELFDVAVVQGQLFLFYRSGLMVCYDLKTARKLYHTYYFSKQEQALHNSPTLMVIQSKNSFYLLRNGMVGIMLGYNIQKREWTTILKTDYWLNTVSIDNQENLWVTCRAGLWQIDKTLQSKQLISSFVLVDGTEINTEASTLYNDSQGGLWIGTFNRGLLYYHADRFKFKNVGKAFFGRPVKDIDVTCFTENGQGTILVGTSKGLYSYVPETTTLSLWPGLPANIACTSLIKDSRNRIWLSSWNSGLYCIENKKVRKYDLLNVTILQIYETPIGQLFMATGNDGFGTFNPETGHYQRIPLTQKGNQLNTISLLIHFGSQTLLGRGNNGLFIYDYKQNKLSYPQTKPLRNGNQQFNCIFQDRRGITWIGTQDGLSAWLPARHEFHTLYTDNGLVNNSIKGILEDKQGMIWITTSGGVSRISVADNGKKLHFSIANFNHFDGVIGNEFTVNATYATSRGLLLMGGISGFNVIDLYKPWVFRRLQKPLFTNFLLSGTTVKQGESYDGNTILKQSITTTRQIELMHNQNFIGIEFSSLNYVNPTQTYYRYRLEGVDDNWREIVAQNGTGSASYTNLAPGTYVFEVQAANNSKEWTDESSTITIRVKAPFWKTPLAYIVYITILLFLFYLSLINYKRLTHQRLHRKNEERLNQMKFSFFTNVSHEFRTPLTLILTPLESVLKEIKDTALEPRMQLIYRHARDLQNLVNQLLDFRRLEISGEKLNLTFGDIVEFVRQFGDLFGKLAEEKKIGFSIYSDEPEMYMYFDNDKLYKIINNLLSNSFKFTPLGGIITVHLSRTTDKQNRGLIQLQVLDSGSGISENDLPKVFNRFYQSPGTQGGSGIGLHLVKEYVKLHSGKIEVESEPNTRTAFTVTIPDYLTPEKSEPEAQIILPEVHTGEVPVPVASVKQRLLVVEDNDDLRGFLVAELSGKYEIIEAADGLAGVEMAQSKSPDLIVSDVLMPKMDGLELCKRIKSDLHTSHIPVILLTARSSEENKLSGYQSGADEYLSKPFNLDFLLLRIEKLIEQQNRRKEKFSQRIEVNPKEITITSLDEQLIQKALICIEQNMDNPDYSVRQFSLDMGMDRTVLYKKLQSITGLSPSDFLRSIRLKRAAQFLIQGQYPVAEVAEKVGFNTPKYFTKYFKEAFGVTPSQYAQNGKKPEE
jgi:signal transduction histidine kinase/DNA-binding response OmpR family regulator/ligand-binding sensor domain-containing protein